MITFKILTTLLFWSFIILSIIRFGIPHSYSMLAYKWNKKIWTTITMLTGFLILPVFIETGNDSAWQFLSFFAPAWLIFIGMTPDFLTDSMHYTLHMTFTAFAVVCNILWIILIAHNALILLVITCLILLLAWITKTIKSSYIFWLEMIIFLTTFIILW